MIVHLPLVPMQIERHWGMLFFSNARRGATRGM